MKKRFMSFKRKFVARNFFIQVTFTIFLVLMLSGCVLDKNQVDTELASDWFVEKMSDEFEAVECQAHSGLFIILAKTPIPGVEGAYASLQVFVLKPDGDSYSIVSTKSVDLAMSSGFSAAILSTDDVTIVFGDISTERYDLIAEAMVDVDFSEATILLTDGTKEKVQLSSGAPYMLVLDKDAEISDIEYKSSEETIKYSDFYSAGLMENSKSDEIAN